jgi:hypothetical protein
VYARSLQQRQLFDWVNLRRKKQHREQHGDSSESALWRRGRPGLHNHFLDITGTGNVLEDASDGNGCGNNRWFDDTFTKSSEPKNTSFFCLN